MQTRQILLLLVITIYSSGCGVLEKRRHSNGYHVHVEWFGRDNGKRVDQQTRLPKQKKLSLKSVHTKKYIPDSVKFEKAQMPVVASIPKIKHVEINDNVPDINPSVIEAPAAQPDLYLLDPQRTYGIVGLSSLLLGILGCIAINLAITAAAAEMLITILTCLVIVCFVLALTMLRLYFRERSLNRPISEAKFERKRKIKMALWVLGLITSVLAVIGWYYFIEWLFK